MKKKIWMNFCGRNTANGNSVVYSDRFHSNPNCHPFTFWTPLLRMLGENTFILLHKSWKRRSHVYLKRYLTLSVTYFEDTTIIKQALFCLTCWLKEIFLPQYGHSDCFSWNLMPCYSCDKKWSFWWSGPADCLSFCLDEKKVPLARRWL